MIEKKKRKAAPKIYGAIGSVIMFVAACVGVSVLTPYVSGFINKTTAKRFNASRDDDDWGPVIEKRV